jgi:hypothetical protein
MAAISPPLWAVWRGHYKTATFAVLAPWALRYASKAEFGDTLTVELTTLLVEFGVHVTAGALARWWHRLLLRRSGFAAMAVCEARG